jgi:hypothetical protein
MLLEGAPQGQALLGNDFTGLLSETGEEVRFFLKGG